MGKGANFQKKTEFEANVFLEKTGSLIFFFLVMFKREETKGYPVQSDQYDPARIVIPA